MLPKLPKLSYLDVSHNRLGSRCAHLLAACLPQLTSLRELRAGKCDRSCDTTALHAVLASLQGLTRLEVVEVWRKGRAEAVRVRSEALRPVLRGLGGGGGVFYSCLGHREGAYNPCPKWARIYKLMTESGSKAFPASKAPEI